MLITKHTKIEQIARSLRQTVKFFNALQMSCGSCFVNKFDAIENGALMYSVDGDDLITQLKKFISSVHISVESDIGLK
jgi:uncharacterized UPF0160 family protein